MGVSQNKGYHFGGFNNKDYSILEFILGSPYFGKLPYQGSGLESSLDSRTGLGAVGGLLTSVTGSSPAV